MIKLAASLAAWKTDQFEQVFKQELSQLAIDQLPLQQAMRIGSVVIPDQLTVMINHCQQQENELIVNAGIFFSSIIAGCNCSDDPSPIDTNNEYGEFQFRINTLTAETEISMI